MDYPYYASDLQTLKQRVSELSSKYPQDFHGMSPPRSTTMPDQFSVQLDDILRRLHSVEDSMQQYRRASHNRLEMQHPDDPVDTSMNPPNIQKAAQTASAPSALIVNNGTDLVPSSALPGLVAKLSSELADQQKTSRDLEERLNGLDDRMEDMDPNRFTPASSTAGSQVAENNYTHYGAYKPPMSMPMPMPAPTSLPPPPPPLPPPVWELYSDNIQNYEAHTSTHPQANPTIEHRRPTSLSRNQEDQMRPIFARQHAPPPPSPMAQAPPAAQTLPSLAPSLKYELRARMNDLREQKETVDSQIKQLADSYHVSHWHLHGVFSELFDRVEEYEDRATRVSAGGIDFRDREITRLDEQLTLAHEKLKASEESATKSGVAVVDLGQQAKRLEDKLREQNERSAEQVARMKIKLEQAEKQLSAKVSQVQDLQGQVMERDESITRWEDSWRRMSSESRQWHQKLRATEQYCHILENNKREEVNKLVADHEEQMRPLKDFCEQKDAVIQKQQDNISWAGQLLSQRDAELEHMHRHLCAVTDDYRHSLRIRDGQDRLLKERDQQIGWLRRDLSIRGPRIIQGSPAVSRSTTPVPTDPDKRSNVATTDSVGDQALQMTTYKASPQVQPDSSEPQANVESDNKDWPSSYQFVWDDRVRGFVRQERISQAPDPPESPSFGPSRRRGRNSGRNRRSSHRQYPELSRPDPPSESQASTAATFGSGSRRDRNAEWGGFRNRAGDRMPSPPLPAPVTARNSRVAVGDSRGEGRERFGEDEDRGNRARRMFSEADLRGSRAGSDPQRRNYNLSKHRSMMDLPGRRLHAYVEDGTESGGEGYGGETGERG